MFRFQDEALDIILSGLDRFPWENQSVAEYVKQKLDRRLGASWHVVVGEGYSFDVGYESTGIIYLFYGSLGILAFKCGSVLVKEIT